MLVSLEYVSKKNESHKKSISAPFSPTLLGSGTDLSISEPVAQKNIPSGVDPRYMINMP